MSASSPGRVDRTRTQESTVSRPLCGPVFAALLALAPVAVANAQVNPANMQSGCTSITAGTGLLETSLYTVPAGSSFVLTDFSFTPSGYAIAPVVPGGGNPEWHVSLWIRNWIVDSNVRWVSGALWQGGEHAWPVHMNWSTGIVFPGGEALRFGISGGAGGAFPTATVCWSGYLVPGTTTSVIPGDNGESLAFRAAPNPVTEKVGLRFNLAKPQSVVVGVFTVEGRRVRTLQRGAMSAGSHQLFWDGRDEAGKPVADGMYFARLETEQGSRTTTIARIR